MIHNLSQSFLPPIIIGLLHNVRIFYMLQNLEMSKITNKNIKRNIDEHEIELKKQAIKLQILKIERDALSAAQVSTLCQRLMNEHIRN
jgi:hypothetical protein